MKWKLTIIYSINTYFVALQCTVQCAQYPNTTLLFRWHHQGLLFFISKRDQWTNKYPVALINVSHYGIKIGCHFMLTLYTCTFKQNYYLILKVNISHSLSHYMRSCVIIINIWRLLSFDISCQLSLYISHTNAVSSTWLQNTPRSIFGIFWKLVVIK